MGLREVARLFGWMTMTFRLDRSLTLYFFGPLSRFRRPRGPRIPILMYHSISDEAEKGHPYYWINTSPARFAEHMKFLHDNNYEVISLSAAVDQIRSGSASSSHHSTIPSFQSSGSPSPASSLHHSTIPSFHHSRSPSSGSHSSNHPIIQSSNHAKYVASSSNHPITQSPNQPKYVVLTFDDGYRDFYTEAFPVLRSYGFTATVFLPTAYIDGKRPGLRDKEHLTWDHARELSAAGISFGSHTVNHPELRELGWSEIEFETPPLQGSHRIAPHNIARRFLLLSLSVP